MSVGVDAGPCMTADTMMRWHEATSDGWRRLLTEHPELLATPCDIAAVHTVGELVQHIVAVELRYAERLTGSAPTDYGAISFDTAKALYQTHDRAMSLLRQALTTETDWEEQIAFVTRSMGPARAPRRAVLFHALLHGIRHYAQLATLVRQHGVKPGWAMDSLLMELTLGEG